MLRTIGIVSIKKRSQLKGTIIKQYNKNIIRNKNKSQKNGSNFQTEKRAYILAS